MKKWLKRNALSILIGCLIGALAGWGHIRSAQEWQEQKRQLAEDAREYDKEVELERARWAEIENEEMWDEVMQEEIAYATEMEKINLYDPDIPEDIQDAAWKYGEQYNICPEFLIAVAKRGSGQWKLCRSDASVTQVAHRPDGAMPGDKGRDVDSGWLDACGRRLSGRAL